MQGQECCTENSAICLNGAENISATISEKVKALKEGDEIFLKANHDFSKMLIEVIQNEFFELPLKAKFMEEGPTNWTIKVKYPKAGEGCCGCCS
jgi:uncharacterized protein (DUF2249 family)